MSDALNKLFKDKGPTFLVDNTVSIPQASKERENSKDPIQGSLWNFDLNKETQAGRNAVAIRPRAAKNLSSATDIVAYWLPFEPDKATEIKLGAEANFFFTSELNGCRIIVSGSPANPKIVHVDGGGSSADRDQLAKPHLDGTSRQLSSTKSHTPAREGAGIGGRLVTPAVPAYQPEVGLEDPGTLWATVIGFRKGENWEFWYQIVSGDTTQTDKLFPV